MAEVKKVSVNRDEEALIKKRLLTQTTTARPGADPPVKKLTKKYVAYVNALAEDDANGDGADAERAREAWLKEIALYEFNRAIPRGRVGERAGDGAVRERERRGGRRGARHQG